MSPLSDKASINKVDYDSVCISDRIAESFEFYQVPPNLGEEVIDPLDEHIVHSCQSCYLGGAYLKFDVLPASQVHFYKVTRSEISEPTYDIKLKRHLYCSPIQRGNESMDPHDSDGAGALSSPERSEALLPPSSATPSLVMSQDDPNFSMTSTIPLSSPPTPGDIIGTTIALPPKKRKKRRIVRHSIIFTLAKNYDPHQDLSSLSICGGGGPFYVFPQNALVDVVNSMAPFQIFCTFYLSKSTTSTLHNSSRSGEYRTKSEELATICDSSEHQQQHSSETDSDNQLINIEISGASANVCHSLKETVSDYQMMCQKMERLLYIHKQHLNVCRNKFAHHLERPSAPTSQETAHHPKTNEDIDGTQSLHSRPRLHNHGEQHYNLDQQNDANIRNHNNPVKRQYNKRTSGGQTNLKITKRTYNKKKYNNTENPVTGFETSVKGRAIPTIKKKGKRISLNRDKEHSNPGSVRRCFYCGVTETPMWRRGPAGGGTLCNACGVKWKNGKILSSEGTITLLTTDQKININSNLNTKEQHISKRKLSGSDITKEKRIKITNIVDITTTRDQIMDVELNNLGLHENTDASTTLTDHHQNHLQSYTTSSSDDIGIMDSPRAMNTNTTTTTTTLTPTTTSTLTTDNNNNLRPSTIVSLASNDLICNSSPLVATSFNSTTNSFPPIAVDFQKNTMSFPGKIGSQNDDPVLLTAHGADDVEAAALLTLLSQS